MFNALYVLYNVRPNFLMWRLWPPLGKNMASFACLVGLLVFNCTFSTNRIYHAIGVWNILCRAGDKTNTQLKKKALRETQTLHTGCSKAEPKIFAPPQTPFPGVRDGQNLISWRWSQPLPTNPVWWGRCTEFRVIMVTDSHTHTHTHTNRQDRLQYTVLQLARSVTTKQYNKLSKF